jgi:CheY-like chemotaxis protein
MSAAALVTVAVLGVAAGWALSAVVRRRRAPRGAAARPLTALEAGMADVINLLNNRLSAIAAFAALIERPASERDREALDQIAGEIRSAAEIVRDLVHLVTPPGRGEGATHLPSALAEVLGARHEALTALGVEVVLEMDPGVTLVAGRPENLRDLFARLLRFAEVRLRDAEAPRRIRWVARPLGASVIVIQHDTGPPLSTVASHDLDYFRPTDPSFVGHVELALAQRVAETCGAGLRVEPRPGGGAEVTITLIPSRLLAPPLRPGRRSPVPHAPGRVLVADDDAANRRALAQVLAAKGHDVVTAVDGVEALERLGSDRFDVVVVDLQMPRLGGRGVYEEVQRRAPDVARRFVFVTGDDVRAASHEFLLGVPQPTVRKPYEIADLLAAVNEVAGRD